MNRRTVWIISLIVGAGIALFCILRREAVPEIAWKFRLPEKEYVLCVATLETGVRSILVAGIQQGNYGSSDFDSYLVCFDLATGKKIWTRYEKEAGNFRGGKRPSSLAFDSSGDLIVGWNYFAVSEGDFETVSKLSVKDGAVIWDWTEPSQGPRSPGTGYSHSSWIVCDGSDVLVKTERSVGTFGGVSDLRDFYIVIDAGTGRLASGPSVAADDPRARWRRSVMEPLAFTAPDGSEIIWGIHPYDRSKANWLKWRKDPHLGIWKPASEWDVGERVHVTKKRPKGGGSEDFALVGRDKERL